MPIHSKRPPHEFNPHVPGVEYGVLDGLLGYAIRRAQIGIYEDFHKTLKHLSISPKRFAALVLIANNCGLRLTDLARIMGIPRTTVVVIIDDLEAMGYIERISILSDRRAHGLMLTTTGRRQLATLEQAVTLHDARISAKFSPEEVQTLRKLLTRLTDSPNDDGTEP